MVEKTKTINKITLDDKQWEYAHRMQIMMNFDKVVKEFVAKFNDIIADDDDIPFWRKIKNKNLYYIHTLKLIVGDIKHLPKKNSKINDYIPNFLQANITEDDAKKLFFDSKLLNPLYSYDDGLIRSCTENHETSLHDAVLTQNKRNYFWEKNELSLYHYSDYEVLTLPSYYIPQSEYSDINVLFMYFLKCDLCLFEDEEDCRLFELLATLKESYSLNYDGTDFTYECDDLTLGLVNNYVNRQKNKKILGISFDNESIEKEIRSKKIKKNDSEYTALEQQLLRCDEQRIHMEKYPEHILYDPESGHWDLWTDTKSQKEVLLEEPLIARNPVYDALVNKSGVVGIDFGTKSTVVTYKQSTADVMLMRIGSGQYSRAVTMSDYENPTVMEIRDFKQFMSEYKKKEGRPETKWNDLLISHEAFSQLIEDQRSGDTFASFFSELKQWSADKERQVTLIDAQGEKINVPPYMTLENDDFDPIEIYAYYIGLFINNMHNKIYLRYKLSFPAKAEKEVREKVLSSFEKGIKKSLPEPVLKNDECMKIFRVEQGASEPAAYAICALQEYGFEPEDDEKVYYGIFDFGGGTTDFDFGVWSSEEDDDNYDYKISRFGEGEDPYLGGENILGLLAYEVFLDNYDKLLKDNIIFVKPYGAKIEVGKDWLVRQDSQYAHFNLKRLMEKLRGVWENDKEVRTSFEGGTIQVALFDKDGKSNANYDLSVKLEKLDQIIRDKIESGVTQFFSTLKNSFDAETSLDKTHKLSEINIFLAGNSCKSHVVMDVFKKHIDELYTDMNCDENHRWINVYPPLGSSQAIEIQKGNMDPDIDEIINDMNKSLDEKEPDKDKTEYIIQRIKRPNGKTGVAFGLLDNRVRIVQNEQSESRFKFYLGQNRKKKFKCIIDKDKQEYGVWKRFCSASVETFDIWFTRSSEAPSNLVPISTVGIYSETGFIKEPDGNSNVYIRLISPTEIEYTVSELDENSINQKDLKINDVQRLSLQEKE